VFILTVDNRVYNLNHIPDELEEDIRYSVLDNNTPNAPDFYFMPLIFLDVFNGPAMVLKIGDDEVTVPLDWSIAVGDSLSGCDVEVMPLTSLNDRGFEAFCYNPLSSFRVEFRSIKIVNFYNDVKWYFPKLKQNHLLTYPLTSGDNPLCVFFIKDVSKQSEIIDLHKLL
jgi:hypothetical protein